MSSQVLLVRSDLPECPEVLLLCGLLSSGSGVPSAELIACKLLKLWAWVAEYGAPDSDSTDYCVPSAVAEPLEKQIGCPGLIAAMSDPRVDWSKHDGDVVRFRRFAEWNGPDAIKRRGDQLRAKRSRERSKARICRAENTTPERETRPKTTPKAHANCDARHVLRAQETDVDVDVLLDTSLKTSTSTLEPAAAESPPDPREIFGRIRAAFRSAAAASDEQVATDRATAWKAAVAVADHLGPAWLDRLLLSAASAKLHRPYAYLTQACGRGLAERGINARQFFACVAVPDWLESIDHAPERLEPPPKPKPPVSESEAAVVRFRAELLRRGITGEPLIAELERFRREAERFETREELAQ